MDKVFHGKNVLYLIAIPLLIARVVMKEGPNYGKNLANQNLYSKTEKKKREYPKKSNKFRVSHSGCHKTSQMKKWCLEKKLQKNRLNQKLG